MIVHREPSRESDNSRSLIGAITRVNRNAYLDVRHVWVPSLRLEIYDAMHSGSEEVLHVGEAVAVHLDPHFGLFELVEVEVARFFRGQNELFASLFVFQRIFVSVVKLDGVLSCVHNEKGLIDHIVLNTSFVEHGHALRKRAIELFTVGDTLLFGNFLDYA